MATPTVCGQLVLDADELRLLRNGNLLWRRAVDHNELLQAIGRLPEAMALVQDAVAASQRHDPTSAAHWKHVDTAMHRLFLRGSSLANGLFGSSDRVQEASAAFRRLWPRWQVDPPGSAQLQVVTPRNWSVPIEVVPIFNVLKPLPSITGLPSLLEVARRFPAFAMDVVRYAADTDVPRVPWLESRPVLPIVSFIDHGLPGAKAEVEFLRRFAPNVDLDGPWPTAAKPTPEAFGRRLHDPTIGFDGAPRRSHDQIIHLSCHCFAEPPKRAATVLAEDIKIRLRRPSSKLNWSVSVGRIRAEWNGMEPNRAVDYRPLVVFNACGTSSMDPTTMVSLPRIFIEERHAGFIGTEAAVPDCIAAVFSRVFYDKLFHAATVGQAAHAARFALLKRDHNPLGILYTVHAAPELRLRVPLAGVASQFPPSPNL